MRKRVENIINNLSNLQLWALWEKLSIFLGIAEVYDSGQELNERQQNRLEQILSYEVINANK